MNSTFNVFKKKGERTQTGDRVNEKIIAMKCIVSKLTAFMKVCARKVFARRNSVLFCISFCSCGCHSIFSALLRLVLQFVDAVLLGLLMLLPFANLYSTFVIK